MNYSSQGDYPSSLGAQKEVRRQDIDTGNYVRSAEPEEDFMIPAHRDEGAR